MKSRYSRIRMIAAAICSLGAYGWGFDLPQSLTHVYEGGTSPAPVRAQVETSQSSEMEARLSDIVTFWVGDFSSFKPCFIIVFK